MLARLASISGVALRDWNINFDVREISSPSLTQDHALDTDLQALLFLIPSFPELALPNLATGCTLPTYGDLEKFILDDIGNIVDVLSSLESSMDEESVDPVGDNLLAGCPLNLALNSFGDISLCSLDNLDKEILESKELDPTQEPAFIPERRQASSDFSIPTILISPCASPEHQMACRVPIQDSAFGCQLTVPSHPAFNRVFPPQVQVLPQPSLPLQNWTWQCGHWHATLPSIREQESRGLFSQAMKRKRTRRPRIPVMKTRQTHRSFRDS